MTWTVINQPIKKRKIPENSKSMDVIKDFMTEEEFEEFTKARKKLFE